MRHPYIKFSRKNVAQNLTIAALKQQMLEQLIKSIGKELGKLIPFAGSAVTTSVSA